MQNGRGGRFGDRPGDHRDREEQKSASAARAALEALFAPKGAAPSASAVAQTPEPKRASAKLVTARVVEDDPKSQQRDKLLGKLMAAEGRAAVTKATSDLVRGGFDLPEEHEVMLKLLDHTDEDRVQGALRVIDRLLDKEPPRRRTLLDSRLRRLEESAEDDATRELTAALRKKLAASARNGQ